LRFRAEQYCPEQRNPQPERELPVWVAVGGTPASVVRAGKLNLPLALAIIGGSYRRFTPFVDLYRQAATQSGHDPAKLKVSISAPGFLAATHREAIEISHPYFESGSMANHHQRGRGVPMPLAAYEA
jgi:alkanesulfonate monooxygenase SsuD/methylene tetrahydromethanopterin reductase-like flavin-dependent oxidoreductase (luciferase family)